MELLVDEPKSYHGSLPVQAYYHCVRCGECYPVYEERDER